MKLHTGMVTSWVIAIDDAMTVVKCSAAVIFSVYSLDTRAEKVSEVST